MRYLADPGVSIVQLTKDTQSQGDDNSRQVNSRWLPRSRITLCLTYKWRRSSAYLATHYSEHILSSDMSVTTFTISQMWDCSLLAQVSSSADLPRPSIIMNPITEHEMLLFSSQGARTTVSSSMRRCLAASISRECG